MRRAVKSTADEERCIRAKGEFNPQENDRLSWGDSSARCGVLDDGGVTHVQGQLQGLESGKWIGDNRL